MKGDNLRVFTEYYDRLYLAMKNYEREAKIVQGVIRKFESRKSKTLLDVGCGTGEHLKHLSSDFKCTGIDISAKMIEVARKKVPSAEFRVANMVEFQLEHKFDVIISLFSSIGYVQNFNNLVKTLENFQKHLNEEGLVIVEPWVFKKDFKKEHISLDTYEDEEVKFARMATSKILGSSWQIFLHYLVGKKGEIRYFTEVHEMLASDYPDYIEAFKLAAFEDPVYLTQNLWDSCRGLFVATK